MTYKEILIAAKKNVFASGIGDNLSIMRGEGMDFHEIADYQYGDDIRKINHNATAKTGELKTNIFNENKRLNIVVAFMLSSSLHFGSHNLKQEIIVQIIALIGYSAIKQHNKLQVIFFAKNCQITINIKNEATLESIVEKALSYNLLQQEIDFNNFCEHINNHHQKSIIFIISDFYKQLNLSPIAHKNQIYALMVRDKLEENPNFKQQINLVSAVDNSSLEVTISKSIAKKYQKLLHLKDEKLHKHFVQHKVKFGKIWTDGKVWNELSQIINH